MTWSTDELDVVDVTGEAPVLGDVPGAPPRLSGLAPSAVRVPLLVVCRESSEYDRVLMEGMVQQTLAYVGDRPSVAIARDLAIRPLTDGGGVGLPVVPLVYGRARATLFEIEGDHFLYSMTSAAKSDAVGDNAWTQLAVGVLAALRPQRLVVASMSRLVRSFEHSAVMLQAVSRHVDEVQAGPTTLRMRGEGSESGQLMWALMAMVAASERQLIVQRLTAGMVAKYRRGEWLKGLGAVPLGYRLDPSSKALIVDPDQTSALHAAWTLLADRSVPSWAIVRRLGEMGISTPRVRKLRGEDATVADLVDPQTYLRHLLKWVPLYLTGEHVTRWQNPFEGAPHVAGMPVHKGRGGREELHFSYRVGRPDLDPTLVIAAREARSSTPSSQGGDRRPRIPALNQTAWVQDGLEYWLASGPRGSYQLRARSATVGQ